MKWLVTGILRAYKRLVSPLLPPACRYVPTCSEYALEAVERYGMVCGGIRALGRILRCHPFVRGGYDPVPQGLKPGVLGSRMRHG
ncbi:MAG: membrane protein insertion efficiency factor YidD [Terriglobales bacterium]